MMNCYLKQNTISGKKIWVKRLFIPHNYFVKIKGHRRKNYGARPIRRAIQTEIEDLLADKLLAGEVKAGEKVNVDYDETEKKIIISAGQ